MIENIGEILVQLFTLQNLVFALAAVTFGIIIGAIPGLTVTLGIILLMPLTYGLDPITAIVSLLAIYVGGVYGGSISAILINTPGTNSALATTLDGYPLAKMGMANRALSTSLYASVAGGFISGIILLAAAPPIARIALRFRSPEYFSLAVFGMTVIAGVSGKSITKGLISAGIGMFVSFLGLESLSGTLRFTFDTMLLFAGIGLLPALIGFIALNQVIIKTVEVKTRRRDADRETVTPVADAPIRVAELIKVLPTIIKSSFISAIIGAMPGAGGGVAQFVSYNEARRSSKHPEEYGRGSIEGIAAAESSNNAVVGSAMIPLITLGIPGDGVTAILLGAFILHGLVPGPRLFADQSVITYSIIIGFLISNILLLILGKIVTKRVSRIINLPYGFLGINIILFCFAGAFAASGNINEMLLIVPLAILSYGLHILGFSVIPTMLGLILGPIIELNFTRSMIVSGGDLFIFVKEPISLAILILALVFTVLILRMNRSLDS
ncbi:MAG: tripartite tricarboxylate transporter permease [Spirochaetales bacterium]|nr:tripartite tricarboxylate transporter permease [Spirochaetales bacterium]